MKLYENVDQLYEAINQQYERIVEDCFSGLHKLFAASYPNHDNSDMKEVFAVIAYELCKAKAEIERMKYLRDPDRVPAQFIKPLAQLYGIKNFPNTNYPEEQRRYMSFAYEIQKYKGTQYGLELLLKSFMPFDEIRLYPMYRRGLRRFYANNDYTGGRRAGSVDVNQVVQLSAGMPVDWRTAGVTSYPTGIYICITVTNDRNAETIKGLWGRIEPIVKQFMPENSFYKVVFVNSWLDPHAVTFETEPVTFEGDALTQGVNPIVEVTLPSTARFIEYETSEGELHNLLVGGNLVYYNLTE